LKISVIIVSYNCKEFLDYCIQSVFSALKNISGEIIVVDNCSDDETVKYLKSKNYRLKLIESKVNLGFSKANNKAARLASGEYLFFLNPDTIIPEDIFENFFDNISKNLGILSYKMIDGKGRFLGESKRNFPNSGIILKKLLGLKSDYYSSIDENDFGEVDVLCGANMFIKSSVFVQINGFNEDYFMYGEDIELSYKSKKLGFKNFYNGRLSIIHFKGESTKNDIHYLSNFYGAMKIYYGNIISSNKFMLLIINIISHCLIFLNTIFPKKTDFNFKANKNILLSNKRNSRLENRLGGVAVIDKINSSLSDCNLIMDANYMTFKDIIQTIIGLKNQRKINFWFLSKDSSYVIEAGDMNKKGNIFFL